MEINLIFNDHSIRCPTVVNAIKLNDLASISLQDKIYAGDILCFIDANSIIPAMSTIKNKLVPGGVLIFEEYDNYELCLAIINDIISSVDYNNIIRPRQQILSLMDVIDILNKTGFKILTKDIDGLRHIVEAQNV